MSLFLPQNELPLENRATTLYGVGFTFQAIALIAVALRLYARIKIVKSPGWDDFFIFLASLSSITTLVSISITAQHGLGQHGLSFDLRNAKIYAITYYIAFASYSLSATFIKVSLLLQYLRLFQSGLFRFLCVGLITLTALWGTAYGIMAFFPCWPPQGFWNWTIKAKCYMFGSKTQAGLVAAYESHSSINMLLDVCVLLTPMCLLTRPGLQKRQIVGLLVLFGLGAIVISISIARLITIVDHKAGTDPTLDPTWYAPISVILSLLEIDVAMLCASIPIFWPVLLELGLGKILIVNEVRIHTEQRFELHSSPQSEIQRHSGHSESLSGSETELNRTASSFSVAELTERYYKDQYVIEQVLPMGHTHEVKAERTEVPQKYIEAALNK